MPNSRKTTVTPAENCATLPEAALRELVNADLVTSFVARGCNGGFTLEALMGQEPEKTVVLGSSRSGPRMFASLSTVAMLLRRLGVDRFGVDAHEFQPGRVRAARPDRAEAMKAVSAAEKIKKREET